MSRIPVGRGRAVTFASRISASGTAAAAIICLAGVLVAGNVALHKFRHAAAHAPRAAPATPTLSPRTSATPRPPPRAPVIALMSSVRRIMVAQQGEVALRDYGTPIVRQPMVELTRTARDRSWAFGTAVIPVPAGSAAPPQTALFVAHASGQLWRIALSGSAGFGELLRFAAGKVVTSAEASVLAKFSAAQAAQPSSGSSRAAGGSGLALPWRTGESWRLVAAFSGSDTGGTAASMLAFAGGDGRVRAAGPGRLYRFCGGQGSDALIEIVHSDGTATEYYQLRAETRVPDGSFVAAGAYLGMTGTSLNCGGTAAGPGVGASAGPGAAPGAAAGAKGGLRSHVLAFAVIRGGRAMGLDGLVIGGWTFHDRANHGRGKPPSVWAQHAADRVMLGESLRNFGVAGQGAHGPSPTPSQSPSPSPNASRTPSAAASV